MNDKFYLCWVKRGTYCICFDKYKQPTLINSGIRIYNKPQFIFLKDNHYLIKI